MAVKPSSKISQHASNLGKLGGRPRKPSSTPFSVSPSQKKLRNTMVKAVKDGMKEPTKDLKQQVKNQKALKQTKDTKRNEIPRRTNG